MKLLFGRCKTAPCKQVKNTCKTKQNYLNLKAEIPMSDDARHILKFQQDPALYSQSQDYPDSMLNRQKPTSNMTNTLASAGRQLAWLWLFSSETGSPPYDSTPLCADNQVAILLTINPAVEHWMKCIDIWHHYICEQVEDKVVELYQW